MSVSWSGDDWQQYCRELLAVRHGSDYQAVPDTVRGDWGIEGFTSSGLAYQCYAPEEPLTTKGLYEKHRNKITADIAKLRENAAEVSQLMAPSLIACWSLLVPRVEDKEILRHAASKAQEVVSWGLPEIATNFSIRVNTADDFPTERRQLGDQARAVLPVLHVGSDSEIAQFAEDQSLPVAVLDQKLAKIARRVTPDAVAVLRREFLRHYVVGRNLDDWVRRHYPPLWERWQHGRERLKGTLKTSELTSLSPSQVRMAGVIDQLSDAAADGIPVIGSADASALALGTVADWLIECPLDFAEDEHA